jgi:hypothetical protein
MKTWVFTIFISIFFLTACTKVNNPFKILNCTPPCWQGLTPGETTISTLSEFLNNSQIIEKDTTLERGSNGIFQRRVSFNLVSGVKAGANFTNDTLSELYFNNDINLTFEEAVALYGQPEFLIVFIDWCNPTPKLSFGDPQCTQIYAFNPDTGIIYGVQTNRIDGVKIDKDAKLTHIVLFDTDLFNELLEGRAFFGMDRGIFQEHMIPWTGYGEIPDK